MSMALLEAFARNKSTVYINVRRLFVFLRDFRMLHAKMLLAQAFPALAPAPQDLLHAWRQHIKHKFPSVEHISCQILQTMMDDSSCMPLLLDFRSESEHTCSHICASVRVDPDASPADILSLMRQHSVVAPPACSSGSDGSGGRRVAVFYCSIGYRSSAAAARVLQSEVITRDCLLRDLLFKMHSLTACRLSRQYLI